MLHCSAIGLVAMQSPLTKNGVFPRLVMRPVFWIVLALVLALALMPHPPQFPISRYGDKAQHALAFAVLAILAVTAWPRLALVRVLIVLSVLGALIEVFQAIPALHRDCDIRDWVADMVALLLALGAIRLFRLIRPGLPDPAA